MEQLVFLWYGDVYSVVVTGELLSVEHTVHADERLLLRELIVAKSSYCGGAQ